MEVTRQEYNDLIAKVDAMQTTLTLVKDRSERNERRIGKANQDREQERQRAEDKLEMAKTDLLAAVKSVGDKVDAHNEKTTAAHQALTETVKALELDNAERKGQGIGKRELFFIAVAGIGVVANILQAALQG